MHSSNRNACVLNERSAQPARMEWGTWPTERSSIVTFALCADSSQFVIHPKKLKTVKCKMMLANKKSKNARSLLMFLNPLEGAICSLNETPRINVPTVEMKPAKNELKGKVPTMQQ